MLCGKLSMREEHDYQWPTYAVEDKLDVIAWCVVVALASLCLFVLVACIRSAYQVYRPRKKPVQPKWPRRPHDQRP